MADENAPQLNRRSASMAVDLVGERRSTSSATGRSHPHRLRRSRGILSMVAAATFVAVSCMMASAFVGLHQARFGAPTHGSRVAREALETGKYRSLTKIRVREAPNTGAAPTGIILDRGEVFEAVEVVQPTEPGSPGYLKLVGSNGAAGWVFDVGIAGSWVGKPIVERLESQGAPAAPTMPTAPTVPIPAVVETVEAVPVSGDSAPAPAPAVAEPADVSVALAMSRVETLRLPGNMLGTGFEVIQVEVQGKVRLNFMLGSGFPTNALTVRGREMLGDLVQAPAFAGGWASQAMKSAVEITGVKFASTGAYIGTIAGFETFDFPQAQLASQMGMEVHGILGKPFFAEYDMDLDRYGGRANFFAPGGAGAQGFHTGVKHFPGIELPSGNIGLVLRGQSKAEGKEGEEVAFMGMVDTGSAYTVLNWEAAKLLGFDGKDDAALKAATKVLGAGMNGQPEEMPVISLKFALCGIHDTVRMAIVGVTKEKFEASGGDGWYLGGIEKEGPGRIEMGAVNVAIGDVMNFAVLSDSKVGGYAGPAAVVGQDLLFQAQRIILNAAGHQLWLEPGEIKDMPEM